MSRLVDLYPRHWRERYEDEFLGLIAERPPSLTDTLDIVRGALDARLHPQLPGPDRVPDRFGFATLAGFAMLIAAVSIAANGPVQYDEYGTYREGSAAVPFMVMAMALLSIGLHRVVERLPIDSSVARAAGWIAIVTGPIWSLMPWVLPIGLVLLVAVMILAAGARRSGIWPAWLMLILIALLAIPAGLFTALMFLPWYTLRVVGVEPLLVLGPIGALWVLVGLGLLRGFPKSGRTMTQ